ncbi:MAG: hypothetical protein PWP23_1435 [Candidatus Sumerlaeota bacterium]|nr:hypothetical protein [Candidatus Sumerlaeota bacterium]
MALLEINKNPSEKELRWFAGLWFPAFFLVIGLILGIRFYLWPIVYPMWAVVALIGFFGVFVPGPMKYLYLAWMYAAFPIGWTVSHLALGITYYLVMTPIGLLLRAAGKDPMERKFLKDAPTYWIEHRTGGDRQRYFRQY